MVWPVVPRPNQRGAGNRLWPCNMAGLHPVRRPSLPVPLAVPAPPPPPIFFSFFFFSSFLISLFPPFPNLIRSAVSPPWPRILPRSCLKIDSTLFQLNITYNKRVSQVPMQYEVSWKSQPLNVYQSALAYLNAPGGHVTCVRSFIPPLITEPPNAKSFSSFISI